MLLRLEFSSRWSACESTQTADDPGKLQNAVEMMVEGMYNFIESILGKEAKKYVPYLGSLFFYILLMNWIGMIPLDTRHQPA